MVVAKSAVVGDGTADKAGDVITYTITAKNDGNIDLTHVAVSDSIEGATADTVSGPASGDSNTDGVLNPGETWTYTATHTLSQSELDTKGGDGDGKLDDTATVTTDQTSGSASGSVPVGYNVTMVVAKRALVGDGTADKAGDVITYTITAKNDGNIDLTHVAVSDSIEGATADTVSGPASGDSNTDCVLNPGPPRTKLFPYTTLFRSLDTKGGDGDGKLDDTATVTTDQTSGS